MIGKLTVVDWVSLMSLTQLLCESIGSTLTARTLVLRLVNWSFSFATAPSSVVHTGVKSLGWENRTPHPSPRYSYRSILPSVVSAVKLGASSPRRMLAAMGPTSWRDVSSEDHNRSGRREMSTGPVGFRASGL